jgi:hypothetical protein
MYTFFLVSIKIIFHQMFLVELVLPHYTDPLKHTGEFSVMLGHILVIITFCYLVELS